MKSNLKKLVKGFRAMTKLSFADKKLLFLCVFFLIAAKILIHIVLFKRMTSWLGDLHHESTSELSSAQKAKAKKIEKFIRKIAPLLPWKSVCFDKAVAAKIILNLFRIPATLYFGLNKEKEGELKGHAWVRSGLMIITGGVEHTKYEPIAFYT